MSAASIRNNLLNAATVILTACAVLITGIRVWDAFHVVPQASTDAPTRVATWRDFGVGTLRMGASAGRVTIVEFSDFECPFCLRAASYLRDLRRRYPKDITVVFRHYPMHQFATQAAIAAQCAGHYGEFERFHDVLFQHHDSIGRTSWSRFAAEAGLADTSRFQHCMNEKDSMAEVALDTVAANRLGVQGTPTFLINDLEVVGFPGPALMDQYVSDALRRARR